MAKYETYLRVSTLLLPSLLMCLFGVIAEGDFHKDIDITWGEHGGVNILGSNFLVLSLDQSSGSGFRSKAQYLYGRIDMQLKFVSGNSAGTVTAYYVRILVPVLVLNLIVCTFAATHMRNSCVH